ncbi:MAG: tellurite resistance/C4-dicarboxylate transporter family protein [Anaerolineales bacterium]|jgi:tellurite resistance protein TehA-like permease|nr:tellurite resistance/C4-dicarboxylate transporter family protein [Anaerolineales bacterium]OQY82713.1 MAG: C4-dicarboxylate ABC transporter [Anaerolineae bacterium UTCFX3]WKZ49619.1 MAG: tellurite resistance/C4-dicarboxylate transporter family protein [Anaerolineales bacterium]GER80549.1 C4-dicarboxylate ABC transporter [Candidatus Denitrolinea symbiosum]
MLDKIANVVRNGARDLPPAYFALVMATGIVSIAAKLENMPQVAWALFGANILFYAVLWLLTLIRLFSNFPGVAADLTSHERGHGFFTLVAGTCVLGRQFYIIAKDPATAVILWLVGFTLWCILMYTFIAAVTVRETKPSLENGLSGGWLLLVVSTQSITVTGASIAENFGRLAETILFLTLSMFLLGFLLYILVICLIFYRFTFFKFKPEELTPPYWINMGAMAITTLAGSVLILEANHWQVIVDIMPFLKGITLLFWATATWWIPLLVILGVWRHGYKRLPIKYDPSYWGLVFPLGMYTVCTFQLAKAVNLDFLMVIPRYFIYFALFAWLLAAYGLIHRLAAAFRRPPAA